MVVEVNWGKLMLAEAKRGKFMALWKPIVVS